MTMWLFMSLITCDSESFSVSWSSFPFMTAMVWFRKKRYIQMQVIKTSNINNWPNLPVFTALLLLHDIFYDIVCEIVMFCIVVLLRTCRDTSAMLSKSIIALCKVWNLPELERQLWPSSSSEWDIFALSLEILTFIGSSVAYPLTATKLIEKQSL